MADSRIDRIREEMDYILAYCDYNSEVDSRLQYIQSVLDEEPEVEEYEPDVEPVLEGDED